MKMFILTDENIMAIDGNYVISKEVNDKEEFESHIKLKGKVLIFQKSDEGFKAVYDAFVNDVLKEIETENKK